jgi:hypothetical protein
LADIATNADAKAHAYRDTKEGRKLQRNKKYFRYSIPYGIDHVNLAEFEKFPWTELMTVPYAVDMEPGASRISLLVVVNNTSLFSLLKQ